ncbi:MAG: DUF2288 domain-containing protein [Pseudomonadota bacterium]|nr:DUF2288 domain-containing protein [Pseudomonadota bacterium]
MVVDSDALLRAKLNAETGRLAWKELERHFARGSVISVAPGMDLVEVALSIARDDKAAIAAWLADQRVKRADSEDALAWHERDAQFWAVVTAPWVLVQEIAESDSAT